MKNAIYISAALFMLALPSCNSNPDDALGNYKKRNLSKAVANFHNYYIDSINNSVYKTFYRQNLNSQPNIDDSVAAVPPTNDDFRAFCANTNATDSLLRDAIRKGDEFEILGERVTAIKNAIR